MPRRQAICRRCVRLTEPRTRFLSPLEGEGARAKRGRERGSLRRNLMLAVFAKRTPLPARASLSLRASHPLPQGEREACSRRVRAFLSPVIPIHVVKQPVANATPPGVWLFGRRASPLVPFPLARDNSFHLPRKARGMERRLAPGAVRRSLTRDDAAGRYALRGLARPMTPDARLSALHRGIVRLGTAHLYRTVGRSPPLSRRLSSPFSPAITADLSAPPLQ